ncbi:MAG: hypothetical protein Q9M30_06030 [Mariprofundaceae bacterium]|nr:hypothetical protein [Mariprofundaceae bacterium]
MLLRVPALLVLVFLMALPAWAGDAPAVSADARYDQTGDGMVDVEDWGRLSDKQKSAYARESLTELGLAPDALAGNGHTRLQDYLDGLHSVYGP